jgi:DNA primase
VWGDPHRHCEVVGAGKTIVLVEDLVSAHKIAASCPDVETIPLFGVEIHKPHMYYLLNENKPVVFWLDKDQQGSIMRKAMRLQVLTGRAVNVVSTEKDPKELSKEELNENLRNVCRST